MANSNLYDTLTQNARDTFNRGVDGVVNTYRTIRENDPTNLIKQIEGQIYEPDYPFSSDAFPEDLGSDYYGHYMTISAYTGGNTGTGAGASTANFFGGSGLISPPSRLTYAAALFMPSTTGGGAGPIYLDSHDYADIKLTNILTNAIGVQGTNALAMNRRAINPGVQVLYRSTQLRSFQFGFLLAPKSEKESVAIESIIKTLRKFAAPFDQGLQFRSPAEIEIKFYNKGQINPHIPMLKRCVITNITSNFAPQGEWSTFRNGYPVSAYLQLDVREMEIITRQDVDRGF